MNFCTLIRRFAPDLGFHAYDPVGPIDRPLYAFQRDRDQGDSIAFGLYPCGRYEDWILNRRPYIGPENPDIILCPAQNAGSPPKPILAAEFNDSIPAGNNAWQRFPRIAQAASKSVPFLYVVPVCDAEVKDGRILSLRHPNIIVQVAQLVLMEKWRTPSLTIFTESPWYADGLKHGKATKRVGGQNGEENFARFALSEILRSAGINDAAADVRRRAFSLALTAMLEQIQHFAHSDFSLLKESEVFKAERRDEVIEAWWNRLVSGTPIPEDFRFWDWNPERLLRDGAPFGKAMSTACKYRDVMNPLMQARTNAKSIELIRFCRTWSIPVQSSGNATMKEAMWLSKKNYPLSYKKPPNELAFIFNIKDFSTLLQETYPNLPAPVVGHIQNATPPILFLPIAGYVMDTGGPAFSRPDKGLVGLVATLFGDCPHFGARVALLYSELIPTNWKNALRNAVQEAGGRKEIGSNNLWRELAAFATAVICDKYGDGVVL